MAQQDTSEAAPQPGTAYPVVLGSTFDSDHSDALLSMRLDFVPASANRAADSTLHIDSETGTASAFAQLMVPSTTDASAPLEFQGPFNAVEGAIAGTGGEDVDCVAIFDPVTQTFRLEALHGHANLKYMPGAKRDKQPAPKATAAAAAPRAVPVQAAVPEKKDLGPVEADFFHGGMD